MKVVINKICKAPLVTAVDNLPSVKVMDWTSNSNGLTLSKDEANKLLDWPLCTSDLSVRSLMSCFNTILTNYYKKLPGAAHWRE